MQRQGYSIKVDQHAPEGMTIIKVQLERPEAIQHLPDGTPGLYSIFKDVKDNFLKGNQSESIQIFLTIDPKFSQLFTFENQDIGAIKEFSDQNSKVKLFLHFRDAKVNHQQLQAMQDQSQGKIVVSKNLPQTDFFKTQPGAGDEKKGLAPSAAASSGRPSTGLGGQRKQ